MSAPQPVSTDTGHGQRLRFRPDAIRNRHSANFRNGDDIQLHIGVRAEADTYSILVNDQIAGVWGKAMRLDAVSPDMIVEVTIWFQDRQAMLTMGETTRAFREPGTLAAELTRHTTKAIDATDLIAGDPAPPVLLRPALREHLDALDPALADGFVDFAHADDEAKLLVIAGWLRDRDSAGRWAGPIAMQISAGTSDLVVTGSCCWLDRADLEGAGIGFLLAADHAGLPSGELRGAEMGDGMGASASLLGRLPRRSGDPIHTMFDLVSRATEGDVAGVRKAVGRAYNQSDTLVEIGVALDLAGTIAIPGGGIVLIGRLRSGDPIDDIRLQSRSGIQVSVRDHWLDCDKATGAFIAYVRTILPHGAETWLQVRTGDGAVGFRPIEPVYGEKWAAMRQILDAVPRHYSAIDAAFDDVLGPPLRALNALRIEGEVNSDEIAFGEIVRDPRCSIIVPLYGRLDFLTYQMALFSADARAIDEIVYVLDQPERRDELLALARSAHVRFGRSFRIVFPSEGRGFGPASNLGLAHARGHYVCFLNSDAFPEASDWLDRMIASLDVAEDIGIVGARLLFADGSIQHDGMELTPNDSAGGWLFPRHPDKGLRPSPLAPVAREVEAVTGACMVLTRDLANDLGGFDPVYPIGDFEDADLCAKIRARGLKCVIDDQATLYHLERQSQGDHVEVWRANLTLLNAWIYQRRWVNPPA
jgi:GT2 family glycosyltransferase